MTLTDDLIVFARVTPPNAPLAMMQLSALDWAACGIAGAAEGHFDSFAEGYRGQGACTLFGGGGVGPAEAALVNGTLSHALDFDDTHFAHIGHPAVAVMPAALAMGQHVCASLQETLEAALVGAEASVAVGIWLGRAHYQIGYHQTATAGAFGATLAAGRLLGLSDAQMRHALGLASTLASGLKSQFGTMGKPLNAGIAARAGVEAALWAQRGMTSSADGLCGPLGFGDTHHGAAAKVTLPGAAWRMMHISHKFHACCHGLHAMLEALRDVPAGCAPNRITVHTHPRWLSVCNIAAPQTGLEAKFSYRLTAALSVQGQDTGAIDTYSDDVARSETLNALRDKVEVVPDETLSEMQARVEVDGRALFHDLAAPLSFETRTTRLQGKARALVGRARSEALWAALEAQDMERFVGVIAGDM